MLIDAQQVAQIHSAVSQAGAAVVEVDVPSGRFVTPRGKGQVDLRVMRVQDRYFLATRAEVQPVGGAHGTPFASSTVRNGWRVLSLPPLMSLEQALDAAEEVLLLSPAPQVIVTPKSTQVTANVTATPKPPLISVTPRGDAEPVKVAGPGATSTALPNGLGRFCRDLTADAREGRLAAFVGRESVIDQAVKILLQKEKNCPCLIGEPGVGKSAVVEGLAVRAAQQRLPPRLLETRILALDLSAVVAGASHKGETEARFKSILDALVAHPDSILFIDEIHQITEVRGDVSLVDVLKPPMARGLRLIGATTQAEYRSHILVDPALARRLEPVTVPEPSREETREILRARLPALEAHHGVRVSAEVLDEILEAAGIYLPERREPDRSLTLLDRALAAQTLDGRS